MTPQANRRETTPRREPVTVPEKVPVRPQPARPSPQPAKPATPRPQPAKPGALLAAALALLALPGLAGAEGKIAKAFPLKVSDNKRFLVRADGKPFFYLGDTAWELFHRLNREDAEHYLKDRAKKGFTVIQAVVLAEYDGLTAPNAYGHTPLKDNDPTRPNEGYFKHVDWVVNKAEELGLVIGMLPTWGDKVTKAWGTGPEIFTAKNAAAYGEWLGKRYREKPIIWINGGDRAAAKPEQQAVWRSLAAGLKKGDGGRHLITYHPQGGQTSAAWFHKDDWLSFNMLQSGHSRDTPNYDRITADYKRTPTKPCLDGEPVYEDHPLGFNPKNGYANDLDVRKACYWALFAGAHGHTYGCHDIWQFLQKGRKPVTAARTEWKKALGLPGAAQVGHARRLLESRPFLTRVPDQSLIASAPGKGGDHVQATRDEKGTYALVYVPSGKPVTIDLAKLSGEKLVARWFDPRTAKAKEGETFARAGKKAFTPPEGGPDWVLVLDDEAKRYPVPGARE